ncbi:hypothetical protein C8Q80DRAFT_1270224 [Daedaleopsis nitida]|nr:hypothetical protein C8Q80DRAFT_1270224 [Daedaleopsis nitida]
MGHGRWTTEAQDNWLEARIPTYLETHDNTELAKDFLTNTLSDFLAWWPMDVPNAADIAAVDSDYKKAKDKNKEKMRRRLYNWFYCMLRNTMPTSNSEGILDLTPKRSGKLLNYQAYLKVKKDELAPIIQSRYKDYKDSLAVGEEAVAFIKFQGDVAKELLAQETDEVKTEVEAFRSQNAPQDDPLTVDAMKV